MTDYVQISAQISEAAKRRLDQYARETGMKKSRVVEDAINQHLDALDEIPAEYIVPTRLVVSSETWETIVDQIENPGEPTPALRELMSRGRAHQD
ncbi:MAG: hypothetical protein IBX63_08915 [Coriobacteriia bacterium]|nr:hypothetical protein [Coriobacteriia bacterium]